ncbi:MAG: hypothetical protein EPO07_16380 [Verrucomicrobia bacterium]|nr:MAG: hypothetical protein EPO07_16380 [Verrucomicrobiota bacterium]
MPAPAPTEVATPAPAPAVSASAVIPLIQFQDVPLTTAIENLARQAGLNYILDPEVTFGQPDEKGGVKPQPNITLRWENLTADQALAALLNNYKLRLDEDPRTKIGRITKKSGDEPLETRIIQLQYSSTNIISAVSAAFTDKRSKVIGDVRTSQLVVVATAKELVDVENLVSRLDTRTKQVLIEARLVETSMNPQTSKGIDWTKTLGAQNFSFGNGIMSGQSVSTQTGGSTPNNRNLSNPNGPFTSTNVLTSIIGNGGLGLSTSGGFTPGIGFLNADGVHAVLSFMNASADAKVISAPRTVTLDNETAHISVTRASPIINVTPGTANTTGGSTITYTNLGVILDVTPRISANSFVNLKVVPEVSRIFDRISRQVGNSANGTANVFEADEYDIRKIETHVMIPSGNTLVMGGLVQDDVRNTSTKVPVFGDIPVLGSAFRSSGKSRQKSNLLVFITPTIVQDDDYRPATSDFLKTPMPEGLEGDWTAWDNTKPMDWSKPVVGNPGRSQSSK